MARKYKNPEQPELCDLWGCMFYGDAKTLAANIWYYEVVQDDGSVLRFPLRPRIYKIGVG